MAYRKSGPEDGFTLLEMIAMLVILCFLATIALPKYVSVGQTAKTRAVTVGVSELNGRENLSWACIKTSPQGWQSDTDLFDATDYNLGKDYHWLAGPYDGDGAAEGGGELQFQDGTHVQLGRVDSTLGSPGYWYIK